MVIELIFLYFFIIKIGCKTSINIFKILYVQIWNLDGLYETKWAFKIISLFHLEKSNMKKCFSFDILIFLSRFIWVFNDLIVIFKFLSILNHFYNLFALLLFINNQFFKLVKDFFKLFVIKNSFITFLLKIHWEF